MSNDNAWFGDPDLGARFPAWTPGVAVDSNAGTVTVDVLD